MGSSAGVTGERRARRSGHPESGGDPLGGAAVDGETADLLRSPGPGQALPEQLGADMGRALGSDLSDVRVHTDARADQANRAVAARAFTRGSDIFFSAGSYRPDTDAGQRLIAHEASHVVQQRSGEDRGSGTGSPTIGRADDPLEAKADRSADQVMSALRRQAADRPARVESSAPADEGALRRMAIRREGEEGGTTATAKVGDGAETEVVDFGESVGIALFTKKLGEAKAPKSKSVGETRLKGLSKVLGGFTPKQREAIAADRGLLDKARTYVGPELYAGLLAALRMHSKPGGKGKGKKGKKGKVNHMTGAEADTFIQAQMGAIKHLKPYMERAVKAGKKGEGFIAVVGQEDWEKVYESEYSDPVGEDEELTTNAFVSSEGPRPAVIHEGRGTRSTAVHESMHRYAKDNVNSKWGFDFNEGCTEFFTRLITDRNGKPASEGGPSRTNYQSNHKFVVKMLPILGGDRITQETVLADIYFRGRTNLLKSKFEKAHKDAKTAKKDIAGLWEDFDAAISKGNWKDAIDAMP